MKKGLVILLALAGAACGNQGLNYKQNDLQLVTSYSAKDACSCLFVMEMSEEYCRAWIKASPAVTKLNIDFASKSVSTTALMLWGSSARYLDAERGCVSDDAPLLP